MDRGGMRGGGDRWGESGWRVAERLEGGGGGEDRWGESGWRVAEREVRGGRRGGKIGGERVDGGWQRERLEGG